MYAYPSTFNDAMITAIADLPRVVKYIDIPLQHIDDRVQHVIRGLLRDPKKRDQKYAGGFLVQCRGRCP